MNQEELIMSVIKLNLCLMIRSYLFDYSDAYILFSGTVTNNRAGTSDASERADEKKIYSTHK